MFAIARLLWGTAIAGTATGLLVAGAIGLMHAVPLAFLEVLPGEDVDELQKLPRNLLFSGIGGFLIGCLGGFAAHLTGQRINSVISTVLIGLAAMVTVLWTHPQMNIEVNSGWIDYLESYRLTLLACIGATIAVVGLGVLLRPFLSGKKES